MRSGVRSILLCVLGLILAGPAAGDGSEAGFPRHPEAARRGLVERQRIRFQVETLLHRAEKAIAAGDYSAALPDLEAAVRADPYHSRSSIFLIRVYEAQGQLARAEEEAARLIELFPDYPLPRISRAVFLEKLGRTGEAGAEWRELLTRHGDDRETRQLAARQLVRILAAGGDCPAAEELLLSLPGSLPGAGPRLELGQCAAGEGRWADALNYFQAGLTAGPDAAAALQLRAGSLYALKHLGRDPEYYRAAAELAVEIGDLQFMLEAGEAAQRLGDFSAAADWIRRAAAAGLGEREGAEALAGLEYRLGEYRAVVARLSPVPGLSDAGLWFLANALDRTGQPGLALHYLLRLDPGYFSDPAARRALNGQLAYLYFDQGLYPEALAAAERAREGEDSPELRLLRVTTLGRLGRTRQAREELESIPDPPGDSWESRSLRADLREAAGQGYRRREEYPPAAAAFSAALKEAPDHPEALFARAMTLQKLERDQAAAADYEGLLRISPAPPAALWGNLGVVYGKLGDYDRGRAALRRSLGYYPYDVDTLMEFGYQGMKGNDNPAAREGFRGAIDLQDQVIPLLPAGPAAEYERDRRLMKEEYTKVDKTWSLQIYGSRTELDAAVRGPFADTIDGALASQAGALIGYRPPLIGFRDEKTVDLFLRGLANFQGRSYHLDPDSYQGGAGLLIKPLRAVNYNLSFERLFKIGDNSEDNWLWRNMFSGEFGERPAKETPLWCQGRVYGEVAYYLESRRRWVYYLDGRLGPSFSLSRLLTLTVPQALGVARFQSDDPDGRGSYYLAGLGANLRLLEGEGRYTVGRWYLDVFAHYTYGRFSRRPESLEERDFSGWILGINFVK